MRTVILVPRRSDGGGPRDSTWAWVRAWWLRHHPTWEIFEGPHEEQEPFCRSLAVNRAAVLAGAWDAAVILDADAIVDPDQTRAAVETAYRENRFVMPFFARKDLSQRGSARVIAGFQGSWEGMVTVTYPEMCSLVVAVSRKLWDQTGGFDEGFSGWGFEDNAFAHCCAAHSGHGILRLKGDAWHLWHPAQTPGFMFSPTYKANKARYELYAEAGTDRARVRALVESGRRNYPRELLSPKESPQELLPWKGIPRILHRTVPEQTPPQVEAWWVEFGRLHPDWVLKTHRDPLDPEEWPLTSPFWGRCSSGAQRAGLIRLEALLRDGGIYVDSDVQPYRSLEGLVGLRAFAAWEDSRCVPDAVLGAEAGHPAIRECIELALSRFPAGAWDTGPGVTTTVLPKYPDVLLLPPGTFYPVHYTAKKTMPGRDIQREQPWALGAHWWHHSWNGK